MMSIFLFICNIVNQTISCQNPIQVIPDINWEEVILTAIITGGAVVGGIFLTHHITSWLTRRRNSEAVLTDTHNMIVALSTMDTRNYTTFNGWDICYVSQRFPLTTTQSIVNSGEFTHFSFEQQNILTTFLYLMETRNRFLQEVEEIFRMSDVQEIRNWRKLMESAELKEVALTTIEMQLLNDVLFELISFFGGSRLDHHFFAEETS